MAETFAIWKPKGISSFKGLGQVRRAYPGEKVGHAGTLDPLAEGILVVAVGRAATKELHTKVAAEKEYLAEITFGVRSATDDAEGPLTPTEKPIEIDKEELELAIQENTGEIEQIPPAHSAIHINGKRAYELARKGEKVKMKPRQVLVKSAKLESFTWPTATVRYITGPGVYIRSLARDLGEELGCGAYMSALTRTRVGEYTKEDVKDFS